MELIDSHCHFDFCEFDTDRAALWQHCQSLGLSTLVIPGIEPKQWPHAQTIAQAFNLHWACGIHPWWLKDIKDLDAALKTLEDSLAGAVALGECGLDGLDKIIDSTSLERQLEAFQAQLELANRYRKPVILHMVKAFNPMLAQLKACPIQHGGVVHGFSGSYEQGKNLIDQGLSLGIGGTITYERAKKTRDAISRLPLDALLLETDAPAMPLSGHQGLRNDPSQLPVIAQVLAELKQQPVADIIQQTTDNTRRLFNL